MSEDAEPASEPNSSSPPGSPERASSPGPEYVTSPPPANYRVKVYLLANQQWNDLGTGRCTVTTVHVAPILPSEDDLSRGYSDDDDNEGPFIVVFAEDSSSGHRHENASDSSKAKDEKNGNSSFDDPDSPSKILNSVILQCSMRKVYYHAAATANLALNDSDLRANEAAEWTGVKGLEKGGSFIRQRDTLIVWTEPDGRDMALSFANPQGCEEIWSIIENVRSCLYADDDADDSSLQLGFFDGLPEPTLDNLKDFEMGIKYASKTTAGREKLSCAIVGSNFIDKLILLKQKGEELEDLTGLHMLCIVMQSLILLNDNYLIEYILRDEVFLGVVSILEYDPQFRDMKASYVEQVANPDNFKEVVKIPDEKIRFKIHQTHRLKYFRDVILARILDDSTYSMLNSSIFFNEVDIVTSLRSDEHFMKELLGIFAEVNPRPISEDAVVNDGEMDGFKPIPERQRDALIFLQQFCNMSKNLQLSARGIVYNQLVELGLMKVVKYALSFKNEPLARNAAIDILITILDNNPVSVRQQCYKEKEPGEVSLLIFIIDVFHSDPDLGLKSLLAEAIRVLTQPATEMSISDMKRNTPKPIQDDPDLEMFLSYFYEACASHLVKPILRLPTVSELEGSFLYLSSYDEVLCGHLCDLLCYFVSTHGFRSKFFVLSCPVSEHIATLFFAKPKHLRLAALRFFRACLGRNDDFYNRNIIKQNVFSHIMKICQEELPQDNLLCSACLELFEFIRLNHMKSVIRHVGDRHMEVVKELAKSHSTFEALFNRYNQLVEPVPVEESSRADNTDNKTRPQPSGPWGGTNGGMDEDEESYFNDSDEETERSDNIVGVSQSLSTSTEHQQEDVEPERKRPRTEEPPKTIVRSPSVIFDNPSDAQENVPEKSDPRSPGRRRPRDSLDLYIPRSKGTSGGLVDYDDDNEDLDDSKGGNARSANESEGTRPAGSIEPEPGMLRSIMGKRRREEENEDDQLGLLAQGKKGKAEAKTGGDSKEKGKGKGLFRINLSLGRKKKE